MTRVRVLKRRLAVHLAAAAAVVCWTGFAHAQQTWTYEGSSQAAQGFLDAALNKIAGDSIGCAERMGLENSMPDLLAGASSHKINYFLGTDPDAPTSCGDADVGVQGTINIYEKAEDPQNGNREAYCNVPSTLAHEISTTSAWATVWAGS